MADRKDKIHGRMKKVGRKVGARKPARQSARKSATSKKSTSSSKSKSSSSARKIARKPKSRVRPSIKANKRKTAIKARPMPKPPRRRPVARTAAVAGTAAAVAKAAKPEDEAKVASINDQFDALEEKAQLTAVYNAIGNMDKMSTELPFSVEKLRDRGYVHSGMLEDRLEAIDDKWDEVRPRIEAQLDKQVKRLDDELDDVEPKVDRMKASSSSSIRTAETAVNSLETRVDAAQDALDGLYDGIEDELNAISYEIDKMERVLDLIDGSQEIRLQEAEGPLLAVKTEWHRDGKEGPEGVLFLTDQRLIFEQREEIKKKVGLFKSEKEKIQKVLVEVQVHEIDSVVDKEEGGFLGMGKEDIMELTFDSTAQLSRARFHLKGQDSADWAVMIKRIQTGKIDEDRSDEYVEELEAAEAITASFPSQCPNCFAAVTPPDRGVTTLKCEFCGAVIKPEQ